MNALQIKKLLARVQNNTISLDEAVNELRTLPMEVLNNACLDHHRHLRTGIPEAVFGETKSPRQLTEILTAMLGKKNVVLATRVTKKKAATVLKKVPGLTYHANARMLTGNDRYIPDPCGRGPVVIVTAGTSDLHVAEEAGLSLKYFGHQVEKIYDAGVAGLHRILAHTDLLYSASVIIVVAGMEGALPSVVAGLVPAPVIGVPSSIGYGTGTGGFSALLGMLNSCAPGLAVVNIDNGFGAACMAASINRKQKTTD